MLKVKCYLITACLVSFINTALSQSVSEKDTITADSVIRIDMNLSSFGVESDLFPSIEVDIDFDKDFSRCKKSFSNPNIKGSTYTLTKKQMQDVLNLLKISELEKLKGSYSVNRSDQPRSTTVIYTRHKKYVIDDYGLKGAGPLQQLYQIVYRIR